MNRIGLDSKNRHIAIVGIGATLVAGALLHIAANLETVPIALGAAVVVVGLLAFGLRQTTEIPTEMEITSITFDEVNLGLQYGLLAPPVVIPWTDVRSCDLHTKPVKWSDSWAKVPGLVITYRNRKAKVLYAKANLIPGRPWFLEACAALSERSELPWRVDGTVTHNRDEITNAARLLHEQKRRGASGDLGLRAKATEFLQ